MPSAYVLINTNVGTEQGLLKELKKIDSVKDAKIVMGEYDIIATIDCETFPQLKNCINNQVRYLENISSTMTLMAVHSD
jgi:DNA-binding Lrp family transcriptional regulator